MVDLPIELWHSIFDRLQMTDLSSCARVSRKFYFVMKAYRVRELAFTRRVTHNDFSIYRHRADYSMASMLSSSSFNLEHLKRLKISGQSSFDLKTINKLAQLEELDIDLRNYKNGQSQILSLAHLKLLFLCMSAHLPYLELDTPRLEKVRTFSLKKLEFLYPESVRCLGTFFHNGKLSTFRNLEYLLFTDHNELDYNITYPKSFEEFSLTALKKLKEIGFYYCYYSGYAQNNRNILKKTVRTILDLERPGLKLFWMNVRMTDANLLTEYQSWMENNGSYVAFQFKNYDKLKDKIELFSRYGFNNSMRKLTKAGFSPRSDDFLSKFFSKYSLRKIMVKSKVEDPELLMEYIARSSNLFALEFSDSGLGQTFFDRMPETIRLSGIPLRSLRFENSSSGIMNFEFVLKLPLLELFKTDRQLPARLITKLLRLPWLAEIECFFGEFKIKRISTNRFSLDKQPLGLRELLELFAIEPIESIEPGRTVENANMLKMFTNRCQLI